MVVFQNAAPRAGRSFRFRPLKLLAAAVLAILLIPVVLVPVYAVVPPVSTLMIGRWLTARPVERAWVPLQTISRSLPRAVVASEDARFCQHRGVDWDAVRTVFREGGGDGPDRGASTITMQVAKNLFLWQGGAFVRKPLEIALAHWIELVWTKRRIMEVYLNIVEWGPDGVFGAETAARRAFRKGAGQIGPREAALMAAALPNPILRDAKRPTRRASTHAGVILRRARAADALLGCIR